MNCFEFVLSKDGDRVGHLQTAETEDVKLSTLKFLHFNKMEFGIHLYGAVMYNPEVFDVHVIVHRDKFLKIKPTRCTNFSNLFFE